MAYTLALLLLGALLPVAQCSVEHHRRAPVMLNKRPSTQDNDVKAAASQHVDLHAQKAKHKSKFYSRYASWEAQNEAVTAEDAAKANSAEDAIFERGRQLKIREVAFRKKLDTCKQGDQACHRQVIADELREQKLARTPHHHTNKLEVTDALGRSMPVLFNGQPEPFHKSRAAATTASVLFLMIAVAGLLIN